MHYILLKSCFVLHVIMFISPSGIIFVISLGSPILLFSLLVRGDQVWVTRKRGIKVR